MKKRLKGRKTPNGVVDKTTKKSSSHSEKQWATESMVSMTHPIENPSDISQDALPTDGNVVGSELPVSSTDSADYERLVTFFGAVRNGNVDKLKIMMRGKEGKLLNLNSRDPEQTKSPTALIVACEMGNADVVQQLLTTKKGRSVDVNYEDIHGKRAIWIAAWKGDTEVVNLLLNMQTTDCEVNFIDRETGTSPLYRAILSDSTEVAQLLIHAKADVNMRIMGDKNGSKGETPLIKAAQMGNFRTVEYLVSALCKLEGKTVNGFTALHFAVAYRRYEIVEYLLQNGVKIHAKSNTGISPMAVAIEQRNAAMVKILVEYGYKFDKRYKWKETPLNQAINLYSEECAMTLVHQGCSLAKKRGHSYFYMAVDEKLTHLFKFLAAVNPQYLQEPWIRSQNWPISIYHRPNIMKWLEQESNQVRTLRQLCRGKVFRSLGKYPTTKLKELNLPPALVNYVSYTSHVKDEMFERKVLDVKIHCPSECPSLCSKRYCPPIEFLYSSDEESDTSVDDDLVTVKHDSNIQEEQSHS